MVWPNSSKRVYPSLGLVGLFSAVLVMLSSAALDVGDRSQWADENTTISISCTPSEAISFLRWYETTLGGELSSATQIVQLFTLDGTVTWSAGVDQSHFQFDSGSADYPLTVKSVTLEDEGSYWCEVELDSGNPNEQEDVELQIRKIPTVVELMHIDTGANYSNGENVSIIAGENRFSCAVPGIKPAAKFIWELDSKDLNTFDERNVTSSEDPRLVDSSSTLTVTVEADSTLKCSAQNKQDGTTAADVTLTVTLKLKPDPCKINPCQNGGTCRDVNGEPECKCPDGFTGVTCGGRASTTPESTSESSTTIGGPGPSAPTATDGLTTGQIVGICVGAVALAAILLVLTLCILCRESLSTQCSCLQCKSSVNPEKEGGTTDKEALELNGGSTSNKEKA
ncbi:uncharacterized protein LOC110988931 isoform X2 [Acanthaster planci]|uniref:Uncharacterized protein LOC110988931 isoform X2 n=1 Tax=Acanthaster planci TaxID=133434 RepID=A0A8B7ZV03_ACAPL|nr:uncharacterized protein LOC110988931 isoform X2 [Acanthaster planci]